MYLKKSNNVNYMLTYMYKFWNENGTVFKNYKKEILFLNKYVKTMQELFPNSQTYF